MHFGIRLPHFNLLAQDPSTAPDYILRVARHADELGLDSVWVGDHIVPPLDSVGKFGSVWYEAMTTLSYVAAATSRVRLGFGILVAPYRHPVLTAKMLATLDALSHGRVDAGFGTGYLESEFRALGIANYPDRGRVTDEYIARLRSVLVGPVALDPENPQHDYTLKPMTVSDSGVPIWIGGNSPRAARRVAELGDGWLLLQPDHEQFKACLDALDSACQRADRPRSSIKIGVEGPLRFTPAPVDAEPFLGPVDHVTAEMQQYLDAGASHFVFDMFYNGPGMGEVDIDEMLAGMETLASRVKPQLRSRG